MTSGTIGGLITLVVILAGCAAWAIIGIRVARTSQYSELPAKAHLIGATVVALITLIAWWASMAFTLSGDYHAWNVKQGTVERVAKRLVQNGDKGMSERYVVILDGRPYGVDDTRAALLEAGDPVRLKCKKDYEWGIEREAHGWACRWAMAA